MKREDVYKLIDSERDYQESRWQASDDKETSVAEWLIYIEHHVEQAKSAIYNIHKDEALEHIRKLTALGVACMEHNETKPRSNA